MTNSLNWNELLTSVRFSEIHERKGNDTEPVSPPFASRQFRLNAERDHDRILFSTPVRRMGDKTQVFPLESIESIRTRLTHSHEVSNLARSMGVEIAAWLVGEHGCDASLLRTIPATLAAVGLAHDLGNPPFGHQGEKAIRAWFRRNQELLWGSDGIHDHDIREDILTFTTQNKNDFLSFEGNAQTFRLVTQLQVISDDLGLNLTLATLSSLLKYTSSSDMLSKTKHAYEKVGYFSSEQKIFETVRQSTGLSGASRHPLALIMEACDDIAYSVLDAEDSIKKGLVSFNDLLACLQSDQNKDPVIGYIVDSSRQKHEEFSKNNLHPGELGDISTQMLRVKAIHVMVCACIKAFQDNYQSIMSGTYDGELIKSSPASGLCKSLKRFDRENAFSQRTVLEVELNGFNTINKLMNYLWTGISNRESFGDLSSPRRDPFSAYVYSRISRNYRRVCDQTQTSYREKLNLPVRYRELQLLTDMISGMTDRFCIDLCKDLDDAHQHIPKIDCIK